MPGSEFVGSLDTAMRDFYSGATSFFLLIKKQHYYLIFSRATLIGYVNFKTVLIVVIFISDS